MKLLENQTVGYSMALGETLSLSCWELMHTKLSRGFINKLLPLKESSIFLILQDLIET